MKFKSWLLGSVILCSTWASGQDTTGEKGPGRMEIHGNVDIYYKNVFHGLKGPTTSFTGTNRGFELGMASLQLAYRYKKTGVVADLGFGPRARDFAYTDDGIMAAVKQAYVYYEPIQGLKFSAGSWATHIGYELLDPGLNANYSMSYLFSTGPFSNTGVKVEYALGNHHLMAGVSNPTDYRHVPDSVLNDKTLIARYSYERENGLVLALNYSGGKQLDTANVQQLDAVISLPVSPLISLGWNGSVVFRKKKTAQASGDVDWQNWWGQAVYLKAQFNDKLQLAVREEYFTDKDAISAVSLGGNVWSGTATLSYREGPLTFMPELRWDHFSHPYGGNPHQGQVYGLMAVTYQF